MGGGAGQLGMSSAIPDKDACQRRDGRQLTEYWKESNPGGKLVTNVKELMSVDVANASKLMGIFAADHLPYAAVKPDTVPSLANMTLQAIRMLRKSKKGFFLLVRFEIDYKKKIVSLVYTYMRADLRGFTTV